MGEEKINDDYRSGFQRFAYLIGKQFPPRHRIPARQATAYSSASLLLDQDVFIGHIYPKKFMSAIENKRNIGDYGTIGTILMCFTING